MSHVTNGSYPDDPAKSSMRARGAAKFLKSAVFWCACCGVAVAIFWTTRFSIGFFGGHELLINPSYQRLDATLAFLNFIGLITVMSGVFWIPAGLVVSVALKGRHPKTFSRLGVATLAAFAGAGVIAGIVLPLCCLSNTPPLVP